MESKELVFQAVHKIGNSLFALETNIDSLERRLNGQEQELMDMIKQNIVSMQDRIQEIKDTAEETNSNNHTGD